MTSRQKFYIGVAPVIIGLLLFSFVPLDKVLAVKGITWLFPIVLVAVAIIGAVVDFRGRQRVIALSLLAFATAISIGFILYFPDLWVALFAGGIPAIVLFIYRVRINTARQKESRRWL